MKVVAFNGSPRRDGNTSKMIEEVLGVLREEGIDTEAVQIGGNSVRGCTSCNVCFKTKDRRCIIDGDYVNGCIEKMLEADGIIIGSPTYFADVSPEVKALIDRVGMVALANDAMLKRKVGAAVIAVRRGGSVHAFDSINHLFLISQMIVPGSSYWNLSIAWKKGDFQGDREGIRTMRTLGQNMAWLLKRTAGNS